MNLVYREINLLGKIFALHPPSSVQLYTCKHCLFNGMLKTECLNVLVNQWMTLYQPVNSKTQDTLATV